MLFQEGDPQLVPDAARNEAYALRAACTFNHVPAESMVWTDGHLPIRSLLNDLNPPRGFKVTANNYLMPVGYPLPMAYSREKVEPVTEARLRLVPARGQP